MNKRRQKGEYGYLSYQKKVSVLKTILYFITALLIFFIGYHATGKRENLFTVIAILDLLPASRSTVSMIMYLKTPKYSESLYEDIQHLAGQVPVLYQLYLTSYQKNFPLDCIAVRGTNVMGLSTFEKCDIVACEEHIDAMAKQNSLSNLNIKIFKDQKKFEERLQQLQNAEMGKREEEILQLLKDLSL